MAWVIFTCEFEFDFRPLKAVCQVYQPSPQPQEVTRAVRDAAISAGAGHEPEAQTKRRNAGNRGGSPKP